MLNQSTQCERGEFDGLEMPPRTLALNHLRFEEANHRFGEGVVVGIAAAADRRRDAGFRQPVGVAHRQILRAAITVMHEVLDAGAAPVVDRLLEGVEHEVGRQATPRRASPTIRRAKTSMTNAT